MERVAKKKAIKVRDPLEPLLTFNGIVLWLLVLGFAAAVVATLFGSGNFLGWGHSMSICETDNGISGSNGGGDGSSWFIKPHAGVSVNAGSIQLCTTSPTAAQRWWYSAENLPGTVGLIVVTLTTYAALRQAQRHGLYTPGFASKLRFLGWFLVAGALISPTVKTIASRELWATMADSQRSIQWVPAWIYLFVGLALLSLARIMRVGSAMREDLEGVV